MSRALSHRHVLRFVWTSVRSHLPVLSLMLLLSLVSTAFALAQPFFYKEAVDAIATGGTDRQAIASFAMWMVMLGVASAAIFLTLDQVVHLLLAWVEAHVMKSVHVRAVAKAQRLSTDFHVNEFAGATARKIGRGVDAFEGIFDKLWVNFLPALILIAGLTGVLSWYAPVIGLAMVVSIVVYAAFSIALNLWLSRYYSWTDRQDTRVMAGLVDMITGNALVKSFAAEDREDARHDKDVSEWRRRQWISWAISTGILLLQFLFLLAVELVVLLLSIRLWRLGQFTAGGFIVVTYYVMQLWARLLDIGRNMREYLKSVAHCEEMIEIIQREPAVLDRPSAVPLQVTSGAIDFAAIRFRYDRQPQPIFDRFSVSIKPGEKVALVGHSGGGKSTFVKLLLRLYDVESGAILIDGQNISHVTQESLRSSIGLVPQDPILFHRSIAENIKYGKQDATDEEMKHAATLAHASEFIERLPAGYDTLVGERGVKLSGGERQRVAIARAILADTPILVLDEATSSLDSLSEKYIQEALQTLMKGRTTIVIAHRLSTIKQVDRILVIERGAIVEQGSHAELLEKTDGVYRQLYELQAGGFLGE